MSLFLAQLIAGTATMATLGFVIGWVAAPFCAQPRQVLGNGHAQSGPHGI
jgi:hypothetical protein